MSMKRRAATAFSTRRQARLIGAVNCDDIELEVNPESERLQLMTPWEPWDGEDYTDMRILAKTKGKTTTDHISPAGPWLAFRGHLDNFSDNMLMGATNAFTDAPGKGANLLNGKSEQPFSNIARDYKAAGVRWIIVGDTNYGEGSSREHAALSPRLLGGVAVVARSFARIHETNLKKQGVLALTFENPSDYEKIREDDRINLVGLADLAPNRSVTCRIVRSDRAELTIPLRHSYTGAQLEWFRAGSALNVLRSR